VNAEADEVSYTQYRNACAALARIGEHLQTADPDEAAEHYLPEMTHQVALIFSFVGSNMTARHVPRYAQTVAELEAAKDGTLPTKHQSQEE
jgi:hypothetical protein